jgi:hypothetical protein
MDGLLQATLKKNEAQMLHGREGLRQLDSAVALSSVVSTVGPDGSTSGVAVDLPITANTWIEALFMMFENHTFDIYTNSGGLPSTRANNTTNGYLGNDQKGLVLLAVNPSTPLSGGATNGRVIRLWSTAGLAGAPGTGTIGGWTTPAAGTQDQFLMFESASPTSEFVGLGMMASNQGTLFGINSQTYSSYRGNVVTDSINITLGTLIRYLSRPINYGAAGKMMRAVVPTELFAKFANDESTLRRYASTTASAENGFDTIQMYLPMKGVVEILGHSLQKAGQITCYVPDEVKRVGAQDLDFVQRSGSGKTRRDLVLEVANSPESEVRLYGKYAPICETPRHMLKFTNVTY